MGRVGDEEARRIPAPDGAELWIGAGRQHRVFIRRDERGVLRLMPRIRSTVGHRWLSMDLYQRGEPDMAVAGCFNCHLSFVRYVEGPRGEGLVPSWTELPVGCETCHGPGLAHVRAQRKAQAAGRPLEDGYGSTEALGAAEEAELCGRCHGNRDHFGERPGGGWRPTEVRSVHRTLADPFLRPDGTQRLTGYQLGGHLMSACHRVGKVQCRHCHDPHSGLARALDGASAVETGRGESDRQCTVCHRDRIDPVAARRHANHPAKPLRCVQCHMSMSWIGDSPERDQQTSDHAISAPRAEESKALGLPNACAAAGCHPGQPGGGAGEGRPWTRAVARARGGRPDAAQGLLELLRDPTSGAYGRSSALELMAGLPRAARLAEAIEAGGHHRVGDPVERGHALVALTVHHPAGSAPWIRRGLDDDDPWVRMRLFDRAQTSQLTEADLGRFLEDALTVRQRPRMLDLLRLAEIRLALGQFPHAVAVLDLAHRLASPDERRDPALTDLRKRAASMAAGGVGDRPWAQ